MRPTEFITTALLISRCTAWPPTWEDSLKAIRREVAPLVERQESSTTYDLSLSSVQGNTATTSATDSASGSSSTGSGGTITGSASGTSSTGSGTGTNSDNTASTTTGSGKSSDSNSGSQTTSSPSFDPRLPAGGISLLTPNAQTTSFYKIKDWVTFAWNYTSLSVTPSAVDVIASCSRNHHAYTIALNQSIPTSGAQTVLWDTGDYQASATVPLLTETYTLIIHDAAQGVSATPQAGYLGTYNQFTFGMYSPKPAAPFAGIKCVTCSSGAMTAAERQTVVMVFGVAGVTVASFTWFTGVAGLW